MSKLKCNSQDEDDSNHCNDHQSWFVDSVCPDSVKPASPNAPVATEAPASLPKAATGKTTIVRVIPKHSKLVLALDSNQDGELSVEEIETAVSIFKRLDQDGNGELTSDEFSAVVAEKKPTSRGIL